MYKLRRIVMLDFTVNLIFFCYRSEQNIKFQQTEKKNCFDLAKLKFFCGKSACRLLSHVHSADRSCGPNIVSFIILRQAFLVFMT